SSVCANASGNASTSVITGATYTWTITNGTITSGASTNAINFVAGAAGNVALGVTVTSNGCSGNATASVPINPLPNATITAPSSVCPNSSANASVVAQAGATYAWTITNGTINSGQSTNAISFTAGASGNVTLGITVTNGSCSGTGSTSITINAVPTPTIAAPANVCANTSANASVASQAGATYAWTITNGTINSGQGTTAINFTAGASGNTTLAITVTNGSCSGNRSEERRGGKERRKWGVWLLL